MCSSLKERNPSIHAYPSGFPFRAGLTSAVGGCDTGMGPCGPTWHNHAVFVTWRALTLDTLVSDESLLPTYVEHIGT